MQIKPLMPGQSSFGNLFDMYKIEGCTSFNELIALYNKFRDNNKGKSVLLTLDDLGQCEYTSTHAKMMHDLDDTEGYDLSALDAAAFEEGEHIGYLSTPSEFFIRKQNFLKQAGSVDYDDVSDRGLTIDEDELRLLADINRSPMSYLDKQLLLAVVPVEQPYEAICGFPNGYFSGDLNPFENYALAKRFYDKYGYELFGIGASLLGFIGTKSLDDQQTRELTADLMALYDAQAHIAARLVEIIKGNNYFFIKYTESLQ